GHCGPGLGSAGRAAAPAHGSAKSAAAKRAAAKSDGAAARAGAPAAAAPDAEAANSEAALAGGPALGERVQQRQGPDAALRDAADAARQEHHSDHAEEPVAEHPAGYDPHQQGQADAATAAT